MSLLLAVAAGAAGSPAWAEESTPLKVTVNGDVKSFFVATLPYENELYTTLGIFPEAPTAQGILDGRLKLKAEAGGVRLLAHHALTALTPAAALSTTQTGVGLTAPQLVDLTWQAWAPEDGETAGADAMVLRGRTDRLALSTDAGPLTLSIGRQPISLGNGLAFTPMDLVSPFFPTTVDQEYKPGVDSVTADLFFGMSTQISAITAYVHPDPLADAEDWAVAGMAHVLYAQHTFWRNDVGLLLGEIRGDEVLGLTVASYAGPVGLHGDVTYTLPDDDDEEPFLRAVAGALWMPRGGTTLSGEVYHQTLGATEPADYLTQLSTERYTRGELWLAGRTYASVSLGQEITPLLQGSLAVIANVAEPSALIAPGISVSISDEVQLAAGGFAGVGARPDEGSLEDLLDPETGSLLEGAALNEAMGLNSEFGFYPASAYVQLKAYF